MVILVSLLVFQAFLSRGVFPAVQAADAPGVFVGIDMAYGDSVEEAKLRIDQLSSYTNVFVIGTSGISSNATKLDETCQHAYDKGLYFIVYVTRPPRPEFLADAKRRWGDRLLGFYAYDENGGMQMDLPKFKTVKDAVNYTDAADQFVDGISYMVNRFKQNYTSSTYFPMFTSDYVLYWFLYKSGYDVVLQQFGLTSYASDYGAKGNNNCQLNIALCRGAAAIKNKEWGAIITWKYTDPPYLESGPELYSDLILAYNNGAKYILIFDSNKAYTKTTLSDEHLKALKDFWQYIQTNPRKSTPISERVAFVLPRGYGYGFRGSNDNIWGLWDADALAVNLTRSIGGLLQEYGTKLDIIYDDGLLPGNNNGYSRLIYWNDPSLSALPTPTPSPSPQYTLFPTQTPTSTPIQGSSSIMDYIPGIAIGAVAVGVALPLLMLRKRPYMVTFTQTGIGADFTGIVFLVDGEGYDKNGSSFWWNSGSDHKFEFKSPIVVSRGGQYAKQYILTSTTGAGGSSLRGGVFTVSMPTTVTGNYRAVYKVDGQTSPNENHRARSPPRTFL